MPDPPRSLCTALRLFQADCDVVALNAERLGMYQIAAEVLAYKGCIESWERLIGCLGDDSARAERSRQEVLQEELPF